MRKIIKEGFKSLPFSQAIKVGDFVFISGQTAYNPDTNMIEAEGIEKQTELILKRIKKMMEEFGGSLRNVIKVNVYLEDAKEFDKMNEVFSKYFAEEPPTRTTVEVHLIAKDVRIEIEVIGYLPTKKGVEKECPRN